MRKAFLSSLILIALIVTGCAYPAKQQQSSSSGQAGTGSKGQTAYRLRMEGRGDIEGTAIKTATEYCQSQGKPFNFIKDEVQGVSMFGLWTTEYELYFNCGEEGAPAVADYDEPKKTGKPKTIWRKTSPSEGKQARPSKKKAPATKEASRPPQRKPQTKEASRPTIKEAPAVKEASIPPAKKPTPAAPEEAKKETAKAVPMRAKPTVKEAPAVKKASITPTKKPTPAAPVEAKKEAAPPAPPPAKTAATEFLSGPKSIDISDSGPGVPETLGFQDSGSETKSLGVFDPGIVIEEVILK